MKKAISSLFAMAVVCFSCQGQADKKTARPSAHKQSVEEPKVEIKVNKMYDKKGNLIAYDSTYTSFCPGFTYQAVESIGEKSLQLKNYTPSINFF